MMRCLAMVLAFAIPLAAEMSAEQVKEKVKEGAKHFRNAMATNDKGARQQELGAMSAAFTAAFREEKQDAAAASQVEAEAGALKAAVDKGLFYYFVCDAYCQIDRWRNALTYIDKALAQDGKPQYEAKKKEIEKHL